MALTFGYTGGLGGAIKAMCYAPAGTGKTKLCGTAPNPLIISAENGLLSLKKENLPYLEIQNMVDFKDAYRFVSESADAQQFQTICIDSASDIAESILTDFKKSVKDPRQAYGMLNDDMLAELKKWRHFNTKHVYITCKQDRLADGGTNTTQFAPAMPGRQLPKEMPYWGDELFALKVIANEDGVLGRYIQTQPDMQYYAKDRSGLLDYYEPANLTHIFNKINGDS